MKRIVSILALLLCMTCVQAEEHMKFMGIPLNGTISQFQAKLTAKGVTHDVAGSKGLSAGRRLFKGTFSGKRAEIYVYFDEATKIVYRAKAVIESSEESLSKQNYDYFVSMLSQKYDDAEKKYGRQDSYETVTFLVPNNNEYATYTYLGSIDVYRSCYSFTYCVHVDYTDAINIVKHENRNMEDL